MNIAERAFKEIYPEKEINHEMSVKYSGKFNDFNANVRIRGERMVFNLSKKWREVDNDIRIGLIQELLVKIFKDKKKTMNIELYTMFIKSLHLATPKTKTEPALEESFNRINEKYFGGMVEKPNLAWGNKTTTKLGHYNYQTDTIEVSSIFQKADLRFVDLIMYHEMLHKKLKFYSKAGRSYHHTTEFKKKEREFEDYDEAERRLKRFLAVSKVKRILWW